MIVEITVPAQGQMVRNIHEFRWTDWEEFRSKRQALSSDEAITDIEERTQSLNADVTRATKTITTDIQTDRIDSRLAHLVEAKTLLHTNVTALGQQAVVDTLIHKYLPLRPPVTHADYGEARKRTDRAQKVRKRYYDRHCHPAPEYRIGDEVWVQCGVP
ncbi:hypothetical protein HPB50_012533 [Hyalomma asiaticum]|uniref:Uncharacterized protein n=1 Tax=Hyalomma asiaticum TaxID=266040 RepID=A0ACB7S2P1_HYAAI|nr:hypothetical protein HPB50_012533 [Hyalomma asiaticum]